MNDLVQFLIGIGVFTILLALVTLAAWLINDHS